MISTDEDAFLPTENDRIKAQIKALQAQLSLATEKQRKLRRLLTEEDLSFVVVTNLTERIKDPTRTKAHELEGLQKQIFEELLVTAEQCTVREVLSYHRLAGRTIVDKDRHFFSVRLETFYKGSYRDTFYLYFRRSNPNEVAKHNIPLFIQLRMLQDRFLPEDLQTFLRILHSCLEAYVIRKEILKEIESLSRNRPLKITSKNVSLSKIELEVEPTDITPLRITILFTDQTSSFPTDVYIHSIDTDKPIEEFVQLEKDLMKENIADTLFNFLPELSPEHFEE
ncbi:hypothetical protein BD770DRAFT_383775 [Pilaira anomala]|nr:hypothetical protein BD770DRAFT_383775 [Pilaira anomala]